MTSDTLKETTSLLLEHDIDIVNRKIYLVDEINEGTVAHIVKGISYLTMLNALDPIKLHICSPGGVVGDMFHLYDVMGQTPTPIHTFGYGVVASAAVSILAAGDKRYGAPTLRVMIHQAWSGGEPAYMNEQLSAAEAGVMFQKELFKVLERHSKKSASYLEKASVDRGQVWLTAEKSKEWGIIDEVLVPVVKRKKPTVNPVVKAVRKKK